MSIRLDAQISSEVDQIAARTGKTKSEIVREALVEYVEKAGAKSSSERPYHKMADLIGSIDSGGMQLSTKGGRWVAEMMQKESDARRRADRRRSTRSFAR